MRLRTCPDGRAKLVHGGPPADTLSRSCPIWHAASCVNVDPAAPEQVFADSLSQELIALSGSAASGFTGAFTVGVSV